MGSRGHGKSKAADDDRLQVEGRAESGWSCSPAESEEMWGSRGTLRPWGTLVDTDGENRKNGHRDPPLTTALAVLSAAQPSKEQVTPTTLKLLQSLHGRRCGLKRTLVLTFQSGQPAYQLRPGPALPGLVYCSLNPHSLQKLIEVASAAKRGRIKSPDCIHTYVFL